MKTIKIIAMTLWGVMLGMNLASCSNNDDESTSNPFPGITWRCISSTVTDLNDSQKINYIEVGEACQFFNDNKCFFLDANGRAYIGGSYVSSPQESDWTSACEHYYWSGDSLTLVASDFDRWIGTFTINGDEATYNYRYENWRSLGNGQSELTERELNRYESKFVKVGSSETASTTSSLIGTVWSGTNPYTNYGVKITINSSTCTVTVNRTDGTLYDEQECSYTYDESTGTFSCVYNNDTVTGKISGNTMTYTDKYGTYSLTKES